MRQHFQAIYLAGCLLLLVVICLLQSPLEKEALPRPSVGRGILIRSLHEARQQNNLWIIFVKADSPSTSIKFKLRNMLLSLLRHSSVPFHLNVVTDTRSKNIAEENIHIVVNKTGKDLKTSYYDIASITQPMSKIIETMRPFFTSRKGSYYSDSLFFASLALHRVAPLSQSKIVLIDADTLFKADISELFKEFENFSNTSLIGIAPELSPVYHHVMYTWRIRHNGTMVGQPISQGGFPGFNSGVLLLDLDRLRSSNLYSELLHEDYVRNITKKYLFKGHLGDQDFYTVVALEHPELFHILDCGWNRQLCTWWRDRGGYKDLFDNFFKCNSPTRILHGNCNTPILM